MTLSSPLHRFGLTCLAIVALAMTPIQAEALEADFPTTPDARWGSRVAVHWDDVRKFYAARRFASIWHTDDALNAKGRAVLSALGNAKSEGLDPHHYGVSDGSFNWTDDGARDIQLTGQLLHYLSELRIGRLYSGADLASEGAYDINWFAPIALLERISEATETGTEIRALAPQNRHYRGLRRALSVYRGADEKGGWDMIPPGPTIKPGMQDERLPLIRSRLIATKDLVPDGANSSPFYDEKVRIAVENAQSRYGLEADGVIGKMTLQVLNVPARARIDQIIINMERWRRFEHDPDGVQIIVNLAGFDLKVFEDGSLVMRMPVAVGRPFRRTPIFNGQMSYLEFSPTWTVPPTILKQDILPKLLKDPTYLSQKGMEVYDGWGQNSRMLNSEAVDWRALGSTAMSYRFVQPPGPTNALGGVKFMFPNAHSIYLHDTPDRGIFRKARRDFSSGCIRVQKPAALAAYLLRDKTEWTEAAIKSAMAQSKPQRVHLTTQVPVRLTYSTVWIEEGGDIHFRDDIYDRDASAWQMLLAATETH